MARQVEPDALHDKAVLCEDVGNGLGLTGPQFHDGESAGREQRGNRGRKLPVTPQAVGAAYQGEVRIIMYDLGRERTEISLRNVRRIAKNDVERPAETVCPVPDDEPDTFFKTKSLSIVPGNPANHRAQVDANAGRNRKFAEQG